MAYKFTAIQPGKHLTSIIKNFFAIEFDKDTTHTDYLVPDGLPSFFFIQTSEAIDAYFGQTGKAICIRDGLYIGYSNTVVKFTHKLVKIVGASIFPVYVNMIFGRGLLDLINKFSQLNIEALKPVKELLTGNENTIPGVFALFEEFIQDQLSNHEFNNEFLVLYERLTTSEGYYLSVEELATHLGYSTRHLHSCFRKSFGMSPKKFIKLVRFNHALKYIYELGENKTLSFIAHEVGYHDQSHFIRDFKEICGKTPKQILVNSDSLANKFRLF